MHTAVMDTVDTGSSGTFSPNLFPNLSLSIISTSLGDTATLQLSSATNLSLDHGPVFLLIY